MNFETYQADGRSETRPTKRPIPARGESHVIADDVVELFKAETIRDSKAFPEGDPEETHTARTVTVHQLEEVHTALDKNK